MKSTPTSKDALDAFIEKATPNQMLRLAKIARAGYVRNIRDTKSKLDPKRLRQLDDNIQKLEAQLS
jgi:hypothetical protein